MANHNRPDDHLFGYYVLCATLTGFFFVAVILELVDKWL